VETLNDLVVLVEVHFLEVALLVLAIPQVTLVAHMVVVVVAVAVAVVAMQVWLFLNTKELM
jgi:hypothetical protein